MGYLIHKIRTFFWSIFYYLFSKLFFKKIGKNCRFEGWIDVPQRGGIIELGDNVRVCKFVEFTVTKNSKFIIGNNTSIGRGTLISTHQYIEIGSDVMIAEYVCIHDNNHNFDNLNALIANQGFKVSPIMIGNGCWIGAHAIILQGSTLGENCILGAGSILTKKIPKEMVIAGNPAKVLHSR